MAIEKQFTNEQDVEFLQSYWRITSINIDVQNKRCNFNFTAWKNKQARDNNKQPLSSRGYNIQGTEFETYYMKHLALEENLMTVCYEFAKNQKEFLSGYTQKEVTRTIRTPGPDNTIIESTVTEIVDDTSKPIMKSFFADGTDV